MEKPDYSFWDTFDEFTLDQAAYLWCDLQPNHAVAVHPSNVHAMSNRLYDAMERGELPYRDTSRDVYINGKYDDYIGGGTIHYPGENYISRKSLISWARAKNMKPKFLFKDERDISNLHESDWRGQALLASGKALNPQPNDDEPDSKKEATMQEQKLLDSRERETLLIIISTLCERAGITPDERGLAAELSRIAERLGTPKDPDTIKRYLKKASEATR